MGFLRQSVVFGAILSYLARGDPSGLYSAENRRRKVLNVAYPNVVSVGQMISNNALGQGMSELLSSSYVPDSADAIQLVYNHLRKLYPNAPERAWLEVADRVIMSASVARSVEETGDESLINRNLIPRTTYLGGSRSGLSGLYIFRWRAEYTLGDGTTGTETIFTSLESCCPLEEMREEADRAFRDRFEMRKRLNTDYPEGDMSSVELTLESIERTR